jgi:hypothetical protein
VAVSTVQGWRERAAIPAPRHAEILAAAARNDLALDKNLLDAAALPPNKAPDPKPAQPGPAESSLSGSRPPLAAASQHPATPDKEKTADVKTPETKPPQSGPAASAAAPAGPRPSGSATPTGGQGTTPGTTPSATPGIVPGAKPGGAPVGGPQAGGGSAPGGAAGAPGKSESPKSEAGTSEPGKSEGSKATAAAGKSALPSSSASAAGAASTGGGASTGRAPASAPASASARSGEAPRKSGGGGWIGGFLLGVLVLGGGFAGALATRDLWLPYLDGALPQAQEPSATAVLDNLRGEIQGLAPRIDALEQLGGRIDTLQGELATIGKTAEQAAERAAEQAAAQGAGSGGASEVELAALGERLDALAQRSDELAGKLETVGGGSGADEQARSDLGALRDRAEGLESRIAALESGLAGLAETDGKLQEGLASLRERAAGRGDAASDAALALALGQLRDALRAGLPFGGELALVQGLVEKDPAQGATLGTALQDLAGAAEAGIPTQARLKDRFPAMAREVMAQGYGEEAEGLWSGVLRRLSRVATFRPKGEVEGSDPGAVLARAESRLENDDLAGAVEQMAGLSGPAAEAAQGWLADAKARLAADRTIADLSHYALARLAGQDG